MRKLSFLVLISLLLSGAGTSLQAAERPVGIDPERNWELRSDLKYFFASNTSYEFGDTNAAPDKPLSRLEFPLNTLWMGGELRRNFPRCSIGLNALTTVARNTFGRFKDSDWLNPTDWNERTVFSKSSCRMESGNTVGGDIDLKVADWLRLPKELDVRPLIGLQWQQFNLMAHDGVQYEYNPVSPDLAMPGNSIHFRQDYWEYLIGLRSAWDMGRPLNLLPVKALAEIHWAYVTGDNEDHHLLREGNRYTFEKTDGWAFYVSTGLKANLAKNIVAGASIDYKIIRTTGSHRLYNDVLGEDLTYREAGGVKKNAVINNEAAVTNPTINIFIANARSYSNLTLNRLYYTEC